MTTPIEIMPHRNPRCPWNTTYRVHETGEPWRTQCGCRVRAWSTSDAAQDAIDLELAHRKRVLERPEEGVTG